MSDTRDDLDYYGPGESRPPRGAEDFDGGSATVKELIGRAVGAASTTWSDMAGAGEFRPERGIEVMEIVLGHLERMGLPRDTRLDAQVRCVESAASGGPTGRPADAPHTV